MPIDCSTSFVDASDACNGRVLICLQDSDTGSGYFGGFLINGGIGAGTSLTRGFQSAGNGPPAGGYNQDFTVANEPTGFQCFYVPYNVGTHTSDQLVIEGNDEAQNACVLRFNVSSQANCDGNVPACLIDDLDVVPQQLIAATVFATGGTGNLSVTAVTNNTGFFTLSGNSLLVSPSLPTGVYTETVTIADTAGGTTECEVAFSVTSPDVCIACEDIELVSVSNTDLSPGDVLVFETEYGGPLSTNFNPILVTATGQEIGRAVFNGVTNGVVSWTYTVPLDCTTGNFLWQATSDLQGDSCDNCDLFTVSIDCSCLDPVIDQCTNGRVSLGEGTPLTLSVSGCDCVDTDNGGSIVWSSPDPELSFNPVNGATTQVTSSSVGLYSIEVTCTKGVG